MTIGVSDSQKNCYITTVYILDFFLTSESL